MAPEIRRLSCSECGEALGYQFVSDCNLPNAPTYCYLCMHSFCDVGALLQAPNVPVPNDIAIADKAYGKARYQTQAWRLNVLRTVSNLRNKLNGEIAEAMAQERARLKL